MRAAARTVNHFPYGLGGSPELRPALEAQSYPGVQRQVWLYGKNWLSASPARLPVTPGGTVKLREALNNARRLLSCRRVLVVTQCGKQVN